MYAAFHPWEFDTSPGRSRGSLPQLQFALKSCRFWKGSQQIAGRDGDRCNARDLKFDFADRIRVVSCWPRRLRVAVPLAQDCGQLPS
jgi:hypothetical protein